ncbi:hypothetical protein TELCIR_18156, partial [Teladorsagia circumcincta]
MEEFNSPDRMGHHRALRIGCCRKAKGWHDFEFTGESRTCLGAIKYNCSSCKRAQTIRQEEPLRGVACCAYRHLRKGEVDLEPGEEVEILDVFGGYSHVLKENGQDGSVPNMEQFRCVASGLRTTTISLRHFRPAPYRIRVFAYNFGLRSRPSEEMEIDFSKQFSLLENVTELSNSIKLGEVCGRGRFSTVYEATLLKTQRNIVVKMLLPDVSNADVEREVAVLSILHHSSLPRLKGLFKSDGRYCIAMKRMLGVTISAYVDDFVHTHDESGELERLLRRLSTDVLHALAYLHARDIVHLDVK